ncbi:hypothetical protein HBH98_255090 [Parastagonospora nodorum]|nr:hypothetical protein HBH53_262790 [Parastagonospora nodorum]KAH3956028.1 hypothetical protein HBH51_257780 [Parastagonospora nodorum]KAH4215300.1 hypothetical protein HBI06_257310 [Parastagonospora nodorum]KAH4222091.1 hypothetical protein HBI05_255250 [Parastagonospora nodorum]KAH4332092.1 hypothetical protein HBH98_255090 [Parastagonospora nodorum]
MTALIICVVCSCLFAVSFGKPLLQGRSEQQSHGGSSIARSSSLKNSIQILYTENVFSYAHGWSAYSGPQGVRVDPCTISPFTRVYHGAEQIGAQQTRYSDVNNPPPVPAGEWAGLTGIYNTECVIKGDGKNPPVLQCGSDQMTFREDPGRGEPTVTCHDGLYYHRAYFAEYEKI